MSFSRLALAAALLEYDGDHSARQSALFQPHAAPPPIAAQNPYARPSSSYDAPSERERPPSRNLIGVKTPSELEFDGRRSTGELERQPSAAPGAPNVVGDVDLNSWGLEKFIDKPQAPQLRPTPCRAGVQTHQTASAFGDLEQQILDSPRPTFAADTAQRPSSSLGFQRAPSPLADSPVMALKSPSSLGPALLPEPGHEDLPNPFEVPAPATTSRFDPKRASIATLESPAPVAPPQEEDDDEPPSRFPAHLRPPKETKPSNYRVSRASLLRPPTLIMPTPLQSPHDEDAAAQPAPEIVRDGFRVTTGARPMPLSQVGRSKSQQAFAPIHGEALAIPVAAKEGEQVALWDPSEMDAEEWMAERDLEGRKAGTLLGRSLMDELEERKAKLKAKKRVFAGDSRPTMMEHRTQSASVVETTATSPTKRNSTLISLDSNTNLARPGTLLNPGPPARPGMPISRSSVFGVDTLWEREMEKLRALEAAEKAADVIAAQEIEAREAAAREKAERTAARKRSSVLSLALLAHEKERKEAAVADDMPASATSSAAGTKTKKKERRKSIGPDQLEDRAAAVGPDGKPQRRRSSMLYLPTPSHCPPNLIPILMDAESGVSNPLRPIEQIASATPPSPPTRVATAPPQLDLGPNVAQKAKDEDTDKDKEDEKEDEEEAEAQRVWDRKSMPAKRASTALGVRGWFADADSDDEAGTSGAPPSRPSPRCQQSGAFAAQTMARTPSSQSYRAAVSAPASTQQRNPFARPPKPKVPPPRGSILPAAGFRLPELSSAAALPVFEDDDSSDEEDNVPLASLVRTGGGSTRPALLDEESDDSEDEKPIVQLIKPRSAAASASASTNVGGLKLDLPPNTTLAESLGLPSPVSNSNKSAASPSSPARPTFAIPADGEDDDDVPLGLRHPTAVVDDDDAPLALRHSNAAAMQQQQQQAAMFYQQAEAARQSALFAQSMMGPAAFMSAPNLVSPGMMGMNMGMGMGMPPMGMGMGMPMGGMPHPAAVALEAQGKKMDNVERWRKSVAPGLAR